MRCDRWCGGGNDGDPLHFLERQQRELQGRRGVLIVDDEIATEGREAEHLDTNRVRTIAESRKAIAPFCVRRHDDFLVALRRNNRGAWHWKAVERDESLLIARGEQRRTRERQASKAGLLPHAPNDAILIRRRPFNMIDDEHFDGARSDSSLRPSCSCNAVNSEGPLGSTGSGGAPGGGGPCGIRRG